MIKTKNDPYRSSVYSRMVTCRCPASNKTTPDELRYFGYDPVNQLQRANTGFSSLWLITLQLFY